MTLFPFYEDISGKEFLVVGGGAVAAEKIEKIKQFTQCIHVIAPETELSDVPVERRPFRDEDLEHCDVCIVATSDRALNAHIAALCRERHIPVNVVDDRELCSFIFPSFVKRGPLTVSITTSGKSPAYARTLRKQLEQVIPDSIEEILLRMDRYRTLVPKHLQEQKNRSSLYQWILARLLETDNGLSEEAVLEKIKEAEEHEKNSLSNQRQ